MQGISKRNTVAFVVLLVLLVSVFWFGRQHDLKKSTHQAQQQVNQLSHYIKAELSRFASIPKLVTNNKLLTSFIQNSHGSSQPINNYLEDIQQASGASDVYLLDKQGEVIASSNWRLDYSFIGNNYVFRPYFYKALGGESVAYFALGIRSQQRGIYLSEPIYANGDIIGVVTLKVNVSKFESDRKLLNTSPSSEFYLTLDDGVIGMSNRADWRLNTMQTLSLEQIKALKISRRYLDHVPQKIAISVSHSEGIELLKIKQKKRRQHYVFANKRIPKLNATMTVLVDVSAVNLAQFSRLVWLTVIYVLGVFLTSSLIARSAGYKKLIYSRHSLEQEVIERTQALEKAQQALVQTAKLATIGQLSAGINHEINQPLSAMSTYLVSAKRLIAKGNVSAAEENIVIVQSLINRVHQIVGQLKHFSKPAQTQLRSLSLAQLLKNAMMIASPQLKQNQITVKPYDIDESITAWVDGIKFEQVLVNVITNASQAMVGQSIKELSFDLAYFDNKVQLSILDTGPGIEQHALGTIFEPFYSTKSTNGLGLGLSISKQIIHSFDGQLTAHNRPEGGAQFIIILASAKEAL